MATWLEKLRKINERTKEQEKIAREMTHRPQADIESLRGQDPLTDWGLGVRERTLSPLATLAGEAKRFQGLSPQEMGMELVGGGIAGTFIGKGAKTWKSAMKDTAEKLEKQGVSPEEIWKQTGTFRGADKQWRQEIDDSGAKVNENIDVTRGYGIRSSGNERSTTASERMLEAQSLLTEGMPANKVYKLTGYIDRGNGIEDFYTPPLPKVFEHDALATAYPSTDNLSMRVLQKEGARGSGAYDSDRDSINLFTANADYTKDMLATKDVALHELQHAIQQREGWARGGSPEGMRQEALDMLRRDVASGEIGSTEQAMAMLPMAQQNAYRRLAGEAEARLTQARMNMNGLERAASYPPSMFDVPMGNQIVRMSDLAR